MAKMKNRNLVEEQGAVTEWYKITEGAAAQPHSDI